MENNNIKRTAVSIFSLDAIVRAEQYIAALVQMQDTGSIPITLYDILAMTNDKFDTFLANLRLKRSIVWDVSDVRGELEEECSNLSNEDALRILTYAIDHHGADTGVTWSTFHAAAEALGFPLSVFNDTYTLTEETQ